jgi:hypothetical protein
MRTFFYYKLTGHDVDDREKCLFSTDEKENSNRKYFIEYNLALQHLNSRRESITKHLATLRFKWSIYRIDWLDSDEDPNCDPLLVSFGVWEPRQASAFFIPAKARRIESGSHQTLSLESNRRTVRSRAARRERAAHSLSQTQSRPDPAF